ncbi:galactosylgalactosylxylosylprotein [Echinococcus multilocularis]|uniref:Galactosylgalactosylxylosylprotein n=1 Tax=Echinococcus multilocularis TaxID=6211 RepID=A0A0S4MQ07_ECHMU|nr:galactosylgalactosylxylosylprotein [Echinococcus multilocularis]CUT99730.1 galactosylgalactosylxylosylprotein [Echinococcus multilocularis]
MRTTKRVPTLPLAVTKPSHPDFIYRKHSVKPWARIPYRCGWVRELDADPELYVTLKTNCLNKPDLWAFTDPESKAGGHKCVFFAKSLPALSVGLLGTIKLLNEFMASPLEVFIGLQISTSTTTTTSLLSKLAPPLPDD